MASCCLPLQLAGERHLGGKLYFLDMKLRIMVGCHRQDSGTHASLVRATTELESIVPFDMILGIFYMARGIFDMHIEIFDTRKRIS